VASMGQFAYIASLILALLASPCKASTFYVDALRGNDSNDGLSPQHGWRTLVRVNGVTLHAGDAVLFHGGQTWIVQLAPQGAGEEGTVLLGSLGGACSAAFMWDCFSTTARTRLYSPE